MKSESKWGIVGVPLVVVVVIVLFIVPIPTAILDVLISANIAFAVGTLVMAIQVRRPLELSSFPTLLLVATLFRLALNVSVTRLVLLHGNAGAVIHAFGHFVVGGSLLVGLVVFLILIIIQFVVITNGAGRVAEVAARFTLDAMPGKQMAIDADLNAGLMSPEDARRRRDEVNREADFYGAMDGASKFTKGDAIAALIIVLINLIGGFIAGVVLRHLPIGQAIKTYSLLSVGDGLASQIPALLMSVSTGIIVTRADAGDSDFGSEVIRQLRTHGRAVSIGGLVLAILGIFPGLPKVFIIVGAVVAISGYYMAVGAKPDEAAEAPAAAMVDQEPTPASMAAQLHTEALEVRAAADFIPLIDVAQGGELIGKVRNLRRHIGEELGFVIPKVRLRDDQALPLGQYRIFLHGVPAGVGTLPAGFIMAVGGDTSQLVGEVVKDPVYGVDAVLMRPSDRHLAIMHGAVPIDQVAAVTAHLGEVVRRNAGQLLTLQQVQQLLDVVRHTDPAITDELAKANLGAADVLSVCWLLLEERVPIKAFNRILEAIIKRARTSSDTWSLLEAARVALGAIICDTWSSDGTLHVIALDPATEVTLAEGVRATDAGPTLAADAALLQRCIVSTSALAHDAEQAGHRAVLVCGAALRVPLRRLLKRAVPNVGVLSVAELPDTLQMDVIGTVDGAEAGHPSGAVP